jgi:hypothetical protein
MGDKVNGVLSIEMTKEGKKSENGGQMTENDELFVNIIDKCPFIRLSRKGLINHTRLRNIRIKKEFIFLRTKMKPMDAIEILSKKYLRSESTIHSIVYRRKRGHGRS